MSIVVSCGQCSRRYSVGDQLAGKRVKCKACGATMSVPAPAAADEDPYSAMASLETSQVAPPPPLQQAARRSGSAGAGSTVAAPTVYAGRTDPRPKRESSGIPFIDRIGGLLPIGAGIAFLVSLVVFGFSKAGTIPAETGFWMILLVWAPVLLTNGILGLCVVTRESVICLLLYLFLPFYSLYYIITRWDTMGRIVLVHIVGAIATVGSLKLLTPKAFSEEFARSDSTPGMRDYDRDNGPTDDSESSPRPRRFGQPPSIPQREPVPISEEQQRYDQMVRQVQEFVARDFRSMNREQALAEWTTLRNALDTERKLVDSRVTNASFAWGQLTSAMSSIKSRLESLPSETPPPSVYQTPTDTPQAALPLRPSSLGDEVSFRRFVIRPPAEALLDLNTTENGGDGGMAWTGGLKGNWTLTVRQSPKSNPRQLQPWIADHAFAVHGAQRENLLLIDRREVSYSVHSIGGMRFWRISSLNRSPQSMASADGVVRYLASVGADWLTVEFNPGDGPSRLTTTELLDDAVRSLRSQRAGEPKADPYTPDRIVKRLADQPEQALRILRSHRSAAEPAVLPMLSSPDPVVARAAASFLADFGTKDALPALRKVAESSDLLLADPARTALKRLVPTEFDTLAEVLLDLKGADPARKSAAVAKITEIPVKPEKRQEVATILEDLLLSDNAAVELQVVSKALVAWRTDKTPTRLLPILSQEEVDSAKRDAAMDVVAASGSKAGAAIVIRWLLKEPEKTVAALIRMGDIAEEPTLKLYNSIALSRDQAHLAVRANCVRILSETGMTSQAIAVLARAAKDTRDIVTQEVAKAGIESVKVRIAAKKPAS